MGSRDWWRGFRELAFSGDRVSVLQDGEVLDVCFTTVGMYLINPTKLYTKDGYIGKLNVMCFSPQFKKMCSCNLIHKSEQLKFRD